MSDLPVEKIEQKRNWTVTPRAFHRLLNWLDEATDSAGQGYMEMRRRLLAYFDRKNCVSPDELADETLNRVARRLEEEGAIESEPPAKYCYTVARFVFMEYLRESQREHAALDELKQRTRGNAAASEVRDQKEVIEKMRSCLDQCTAKLEPASRQLILRYYFGRERLKIENRRHLAASLGITMNALSIRACRIRDKLERCVKKCVAE